MEAPKRTFFNNLIRISRPFSLLAGILLYALGVGIVSFLGQPVNWQTYFAGQAAITFLQLSSYYLKAYYDPLSPQEEDAPVDKAPLNGRPRTDGKLPRSLVLQMALLTMTLGAALTVLLLAAGSIKVPAFVLLGVAFLLAFFYAVPPLRLVYSGYGELVSAVLLANLFPALGYLFQTGELHRLLAMLTFPVTALYLAAILAAELQPYGADVRYERRTMMVRMGWQRGMITHNVLILVGYLLFATAALLSLPWVLVWPAFLTLPVGLFQIWQINQIAQGAPARWRMLNLTAGATVGLVVYLLNLALWTH